MFHPKDDPCCLPCCPACPCRCPAPVITVGSTTTTPPGTEAKVTATPTADGVRLDFFIPQGEPGTAPEDVFASFYTFMQRFANGSAIPFAQAVEDPTGRSPCKTPRRSDWSRDITSSRTTSPPFWRRRDTFR